MSVEAAFFIYLEERFLEWTLHGEVSSGRKVAEGGAGHR